MKSATAAWSFSGTSYVSDGEGEPAVAAGGSVACVAPSAPADWSDSEPEHAAMTTSNGVRVQAMSDRRMADLVDELQRALAP